MNVDIELFALELLLIKFIQSSLSIRFCFVLDIGVSLALTVSIGLKLARYDFSVHFEHLK
jgi:hypothetical protein